MAQKFDYLKSETELYGDIYIGVTNLVFCSWERIFQKNQNETPFTEEGRQKHFKRTKKKRRNARLDPGRRYYLKVIYPICTGIV